MTYVGHAGNVEVATVNINTCQDVTFREVFRKSRKDFLQRNPSLPSRKPRFHRNFRRFPSLLRRRTFVPPPEFLVTSPQLLSRIQDPSWHHTNLGRKNNAAAGDDDDDDDDDAGDCDCDCDCGGAIYDFTKPL